MRASPLAAVLFLNAAGAGVLLVAAVAVALHRRDRAWLLVALAFAPFALLVLSTNTGQWLPVVAVPPLRVAVALGLLGTAIAFPRPLERGAWLAAAAATAFAAAWFVQEIALRGTEAAHDVLEHFGAYQLRLLALLVLAVRFPLTRGEERRWVVGVAVALSASLGQREGARMLESSVPDAIFALAVLAVAMAWLWNAARSAAGARAAVLVALLWLAAVLSGMAAHLLLGSYAAVQASGLFGVQLALVAAALVVAGFQWRLPKGEA